MRKILSLIIALSLLLPGCYSASAEDCCTWGCFTYSLPDGFTCDNLNQDQIQAVSENGLIAIQRYDLESLGFPVSSDVLGEELVLDTYLEAIASTLDLKNYDKGVVDGAAYNISTYSTSVGSLSADVVLFSILKKNTMLYSVMYGESLDEGIHIAEEFFDSIHILDEPEKMVSASDLKWDVIDNDACNTVVFEACGKVVSVTIPDEYAIYMPGMLDDSEVPSLLGTTAEYVDDYVATMVNSGYCVFAFGKNEPDQLKVAVKDVSAGLGSYAVDGEIPDSIVKVYNDGYVSSHGDYKVEVNGGKSYYHFPDYTEGYKIKSISGLTETLVLFTPCDGQANESEINTITEIAHSIEIADIS